MADKNDDNHGAEPERGSVPVDVTHTVPQAGALPKPVDIQSYIGARLRQAFDDVAKQPVPDRFLELMAELDRS